MSRDGCVCIAITVRSGGGGRLPLAAAPGLCGKPCLWHAGCGGMIMAGCAWAGSRRSGPGEVMCAETAEQPRGCRCVPLGALHESAGAWRDRVARCAVAGGCAQCRRGEGAWRPPARLSTTSEAYGTRQPSGMPERGCIIRGGGGAGGGGAHVGCSTGQAAGQHGDLLGRFVGGWRLTHRAERAAEKRRGVPSAANHE
jgi:hypothetical protein